MAKYFDLYLTYIGQEYKLALVYLTLYPYCSNVPVYTPNLGHELFYMVLRTYWTIYQVNLHSVCILLRTKLIIQLYTNIMT